MGMRFEDWHEASDVAGANKIIELLFDIKPEETKDE